MNGTGGEQHPVGPYGPQQPERLSDILPSVLPFAKEYLANQRYELALKERELEQDAKLDEKELNIAAQQWRWRILLLAAVGFAFFAMAAGLIFYLRELNAGLLLLSHLAALTAGTVGGLGWARRKLENGDGGKEAR